MKQPKKQAGINVFYSYASADSAWRDQLARHLGQFKHDGLIEEWSDEHILAGSDRAQALEQALRSSDIILLLISADFLASDTCQIAMQRALECQRLGKARVIPVLIRPCDWRSSSFADLQYLPRDGQPITTWNHPDEALTDVVAGIRNVIEALSPSAASAPRAALPEIWNVPYSRNPFFTGRDEILSQLHMRLQTGQSMTISQSPQAISGLGGIGKTQIAVEYAYRFGREYQAVLWVHAENRETLISSYIVLAALLYLQERDVQEQTLTIQAVKQWLQMHTGWLLILDNADDLALANQFLPPIFGGQVLLTTRAKAMGRFAHRLEVETLPIEEGALFLLRRAGLLSSTASLAQAGKQNQILAWALCEELGGLPLALDQAGAYIEETGCSLGDYRRLWQQRRATLLTERRGFINDHPDPVATTWNLSFERVEQASPAAADLLRVCALLSPDAIPEELFTRGALHLGSHLVAVGRDPYLLDHMREVLLSYSLVRRITDESTGASHETRGLLAIHRLVQAVIKDAMPLQTRSNWAERVVLALNAVFPESEPATWAYCEQLLPHALVASQLIETYDLSRIEASQLLCTTASYLLDRKHHQQAERLYQQALFIREQQLGPEHPDVAFVLHRLAFVYRQQGKYVEAEPLYQRALSILEQQLGPEHPDVAFVLANLATLYTEQGKQAGVELLYQQALHIQEQQLGPTHPDVGVSLHGLARFYFRWSKYAEAEPLYQRALSIQKQQLGPEHPRVGRILTNLANLYWKQGKYPEAEPLYRRVLSMREQQLGPEHPDVAFVLSRLAFICQQQSKYPEAELLYQRVLSIREPQLESEHPDVARFYWNRGYVFLRLRKREEACTDFMKWADLQPKNVNAAWTVVYASLNKQRPGVEIAERLEVIAELVPHDHSASLCRGVALGLRGKPQEGLTEIEQALHFDPHLEDEWFWKGMMHASLGQSTDAAKSIDQALRTGLPPILLTPLFWLEQENPQFYQEYAEPLLKQHELT